METIDDIVVEMRKRFEPYAKSDSNDARYVAYLGYAEFADRIEAAVEYTLAVEKAKAAGEGYAAGQQSVTDCNRLGNMAKAREALKHVEKLAREFSVGNYHVSEFPKILLDAIQPALSAPARNCDLSEVAEGQPIDLAEQAWRVYRKSHNDYFDVHGLLRCIGWLLTEAKGEAK